MRTFAKLADLQPLVGEELDPRLRDLDPVAVGDVLADATNDHQWIHVDVERAKAGPFGAPIAHGFMTLSLLPEMGASAMEVLDARMGVNYGLNRVRFPAPVPAGSRVRGRFKLLGFETIEGGAQLTFEVLMEREGSDKPVCVAESVGRRFV